MKNIQSINEFWGAVIRRDMSSAVREEDKFHNYEELLNYVTKEITKQGENVVIKNLDVSGIKDLSHLFYDLPNYVKTIDLSGWKTEDATSLEGLFYFSGSLESIDLSGWNTSSVTDMSWAFCDCINLKSIVFPDWNTDSARDIRYMFDHCVNLKSLDLSGWNTSSVVDMSWMFSGCKSLQSLDLTGWDTNDMADKDYIFKDCPAPYEVVDNKIVRK